MAYFCIWSMIYARVSLLHGGSSAIASNSPANTSSSEPESIIHTHTHTHTHTDAVCLWRL